MRVIAAEPQAQNLAVRTTELSSNTRIEDTTAQSLQRQATSLAEGQRILRETASTVSGANQQAANARAEGGNKGGVAGLVDVGVQLADRAATITLGNQTRELARQEAIRKQQEAEREARRQEQLTYAESIANDMVMEQRVNGTVNTREGIRQVINDPMFADLSAEDRREFERRFQATIRDTEKDMYRDVERSTSELVRSKFKNVEAKLMFDTSASVARLRYTTEPGAQNLIVEEILQNAVVASENAGLPLSEQLQLRASIYEQVRGAVSEQQSEALGINRTLEDFTFVQEEINRVETLFANGSIDDAGRDAYINALMIQYPSIKGIKFTTAESARKAAIDRASDVQKLRDLAREDYAFQNAVPVLENSIIAASALEVVIDPSLRVKYSQIETGDNQRVLAMADHFAAIQSRLKDPARTRQLQAQSETLRKAQAQLEAILMYRSRPDEYKAAQKAGLSPPSITDLAVQNAQAAYDRALGEFNAITSSIESDLGELQKFGVVFDQATGQLGISQEIADELNTIRNTPSGGGSTPPKSTSPSSGPGLITSGFAGFQTPALGKTNAGKNGTVKMVPPVRDVFRGHFVDNSPAGSYDFTLIDKSDNTQTAIPSPVTGIVTEATTRRGYGNTVAVYDPSTNKEWFIAHMAGQAPVQVGQQVVAGQKIGVQGSTGNSTGDHIHLEIYSGKWADGGQRITNRATTQPLVETYLRRTIEGSWPQNTTNSLGLPPSQPIGRLNVSTSRVPTYSVQLNEPPPPGAMVLPGGGYILGGKLHLPAARQVASAQTSATSPSTFNNNRPLTMPQTSRYREDYPPKNDPNANYGYDSIAKDPSFARALAATADRLDIPAQWLADIMAFESTQNGIIHNPAAENSEGAVGLIQFYPGGGLAEVAKGMGVSEAEAARRLKGMTRAQQMPWVENHLKLMLRYAGRERYERMDDVFAAIFGGHNLLAKSDAERQNIGDGAISYALYRKRIGSHVGRSYSTERGSRPTHTRPQHGCATCTQMIQTQGRILPHQAP